MVAAPPPRHSFVSRLRAVARLALLLWAMGSVALTGWLLSRNPFAAPFIDRSLTEARFAIESAVAARATPDWLIPQLHAALEADDMQRLDLLAALAVDQNTPLPEDLATRIAQVQADRTGLWAQLSDCGTCMTDMAACPSLRLMAACTVPFELSPAGDAAALIRQSRNYVTGDEVDEVEAALAGIGIAATAAGLVTLGGSLTLKGAATTLRVARRADALSPGMNRALLAAVRGPAPAQALGDMAQDLRRISRASSTPEALSVLRHADSAEDLTRLARFSEAAGPKTGRALAVLGKADSLRLLRRLGDLAMAAAGMIALVLGQIAALLGALVQMALRRALRPARQRRRGPRLRTEPPLRRVAIAE
ncbi:MAG: hypothetical protein ACK4YU_09500 [Paracoccus sp. (in: a-proteobacteria)]